MFGPAGVWYVYLCYGVHWMLNVVCGPPDYPAGVLIRGVDVDGLRIDGPGRVTNSFGIDKRFNGLLAAPESKLWIAPGQEPIGEDEINKTPRVGVDYAGPEWAAKPWRFVIKTRKGEAAPEGR
jgi:DNA-3-methyladenine glycosylase